jgi:[ribosomal protein S18]-alanine N-acetyltransferase
VAEPASPTDPQDSRRPDWPDGPGSPDGPASLGQSYLDDPVTVRLVPLRRRHLRSVMRIEQQVYPRPWSLGVFMSELGQPASRHYVAARAGGRVVGYAGVMFGYDEGHVTNIAVDPAWQRHRIGTRLLVHLFHAVLARPAGHITLEVRVSNTAAQAMYRRFGFETEGIRKNYYAETNEDALVMWVHDISTPERLAALAAIESEVLATTLDETGLARQRRASEPITGEGGAPV